MFSATDQIRHKLDKLMAKPDKPVEIPQRRVKKVNEGPELVRNIMSSSAGAGSGEFHVYRHLRRKEYARQKEMDIESKQETLNDKYHQKLELNKRLAEERTNKKRLKRLKKKEKLKRKKTEVGQQTSTNRESEEEESSESESDQASKINKDESIKVEEDRELNDKKEERKSNDQE